MRNTQIDPAALASYLALGYVAGDGSLTLGIRSLPPGHYMLLAQGRTAKPQRYWDVAQNFRQKRGFPNEAAAAEELQALVDDAVRLRLVSDVPLGAFLSGGIDSSTTVAAMAHLGDRGRVQTFCAGFAERGYSETANARAVAAHLQVDHHDCEVAAEAATLIPAFIAAGAEPFADTSALPMYLVAGFARKRVTVCLSGDGADEIFAGYETYVADKAHAMLNWVPHWGRRSFRFLAESLLPVTHGKVGIDFKIRQFANGLLCDAARAHYTWRLLIDRDERAALLRPEWQQAVADTDPFAAFAPHFCEVDDCDPIDQAMYVDLKTWLPNDILVKVDRMTMAHSLEARAPFLDHRLIEFAASLPVSAKLRGLRKKHLLKKSQEGRLPRDVLARRKLGFNAPVSPWLLGPLREFARDTLVDRQMDTWFRRRAVDKLWDDHEGRRRDNGMRLMNLLCFALWLRSV